MSIAHDALRVRLAWASANGSSSERQIAWAEVTRVVAFKRDLLTTDLICLRLESGKEVAMELNEEMQGWGSMLEALPQYLPGALDADQLFRAVTQPAFATNETNVYVRQSSQAV